MDAPPIHYARTEDGVNIAYREVGAGVPLLYAGGRVGLRLRQEYEFYRDLMTRLGRGRRLIDFDWRGFGLSQRDIPSPITPAHMVSDLETVAKAARAERFVLVAVGLAGTAALQYARRHPHRVSHLVLHHTSLGMAIAPMSKVSRSLNDDWPYHHRMVLSTWHQPRAHEEQLLRLITEGMNRDAHDTNVALSYAASSDDLALEVPVLVLHAQEWDGLPLAISQQITAALPDARLVAYAGDSFIPYGDSIEHVAHAIDSFVAETTPRNTHTPSPGHDPAQPSSAPAHFTHREREVLALVATGRSTREIATGLTISPATVTRLTISPATVTRHISNILTKTGLSNRTELAAYAADHGLREGPG